MHDTAVLPRSSQHRISQQRSLCFTTAARCTSTAVYDCSSFDSESEEEISAALQSHSIAVQLYLGIN